MRPMKKFFLLLGFLGVFAAASAQKEYVTMTTWGDYIILSGAVPSDMEIEYSGTDFNANVYPAQVWIGNVVNLLSDRGFVVDKMNTIYNGDRAFFHYLFSKEKSGDSPASSIQKVASDDASDVHEVARFNLQGRPVMKDEKGIQIIVFSNYTTKTVIVE